MAMSPKRTRRDVQHGRARQQLAPLIQGVAPLRDPLEPVEYVCGQGLVLLQQLVIGQLTVEGGDVDPVAVVVVVVDQLVF
jgi:hypothetical protein